MGEEEICEVCGGLKNWKGFGTALKPAFEPIIVARKPLQGTVAENVQRYGTGAMNIDACRIETNQDDYGRSAARADGIVNKGTFFSGLDSNLAANNYASPKGRWPSNLIHDGSAEVLAGFPMTTTNSIGKALNRHQFEKPLPSGYGGYKDYVYQTDNASTGSAARFFYCAKASKVDRDEGCEGFEVRKAGNYEDDNYEWPDGRDTKSRNHHPTVKPTALMRYLCRLVTPSNGTILDPFMGSGSTGKAAMLEGFNFVGVDTEIEYVEIAARRIEAACEKVGIVVDQPMMFETKRKVVDRPKQLMLL